MRFSGLMPRRLSDSRLHEASNCLNHLSNASISDRSTSFAGRVAWDGRPSIEKP